MATLLGCGDPEKRGSIAYRCLHCGQGKHVGAMRGQSSLCLRGAKVSVDTWVSQVSQRLHEGVISRHIVLTVPALLRHTLSQQSHAFLSPFMRCGVTCWEAVLSRVSGTSLKGGSMVVSQTHGRQGQYTPHLHLIATSGGGDQQASQWGQLDSIPSPLLRQQWPWSLLTRLRQTVKTPEITR